MAEKDDIFAICNVHLEGHPDLHELRGKQLHSTLKKAKKTKNARVSSLQMGCVKNKVD